MSERGTELQTRASRQLDEMAEFLGTLQDADLRKAYPEEGAGDAPRDTVGAVAAHMAENYYLLGRFLRATGYVPGSPPAGNDHGHAPAIVADVVDRLNAGKSPIVPLGNLTDEQLDTVPPADSSRFFDGRWTLEELIDAVLAHQAAHLTTLKRAVA